MSGNLNMGANVENTEPTKQVSCIFLLFRTTTCFKSPSKLQLAIECRVFPRRLINGGFFMNNGLFSFLLFSGNFCGCEGSDARGDCPY